jgi:G3E family GTPase
MAPDVNLNLFFKGDLAENTGAALQALMRAILTRAQFLPTVRHVIGWRGLKQSVDAVEGWTAKIKDHAGVFGLFFMGVEPVPGWATGRFGLCYFPDPSEALVERYSVRAAAFTQTDDYWPCVRDFLQHPEMGELFGVGSLLLAVRADQRALAVAMEGASSQRSLARDGVRLLRDGQMVELVAPGGCDQDLPAFETALGFFDVLAASMTFNLEQPPGSLIEKRYPATQAVYDGEGGVSLQVAPDLWSGFVLLGYGEEDFEALCSAVSPSESASLFALAADGSDAAPPRYRERLWWRAHLLKDSKSVDKKILGVDERPPLIILTGFLGSGKTSFLQHFIEYQTQRSRFVAVIQNEIGEIGLDGKLLDYKVTEIDEGCVCCSLVGNLKHAIHGILEGFSPDYVILETSGMANPKNVLDDIHELSEMIRLDATVTVVDALNFQASLDGYAIAAEQVAAADVLLLNKSDLVGEAQLEAVRRQLGTLNPNAPLCVTRRGDVNPAMIFDGEAGPSSKDQDASPGAMVRNPHVHPTHAQDGLCARTIRLPHPLDRGRFLEGIDSVPASIFRIKGIIDMSDPPQTMLFQYVAGRYELSTFINARAPDRFLTVIGRAADPETLNRVEELLRSAEV